jgi:hypothetical protein
MGDLSFGGHDKTRIRSADGCRVIPVSLPVGATKIGLLGSAIDAGRAG